VGFFFSNCKTPVNDNGTVWPQGPTLASRVRITTRREMKRPIRMRGTPSLGFAFRRLVETSSSESPIV